MRLLLGDLATNTLEEELPFLGLSWEHEVNKPGGISFKLPLPPYAAVLRDRTWVGRKVLYVVDDDLHEVPFCGIPWTVSADVNARTLDVKGAGLLSILAKRMLLTDLVFAATDQAQIVVGLLDRALTPQPGDGTASRAIPLTYKPLTNTGRVRDRNYLQEEAPLPIIGDLLGNLAAVIDGFDFLVRSTWNVETAPVNTLILQYPAGGVLTNEVLVTTDNVVVPSIEFDGSTVATDVYVLGNGIQGHASQTLAGWPRLDGQESASTVTETETVDEQAQRAALDRASPRYSTQVTWTLQLGAPSPAVHLNHLVRLADLSAVGIDAIFRVVKTATTVQMAGRSTVYTLTQPLTPLPVVPG